MSKKEKTVIVARLTVKSGQEKAFLKVASNLVNITRTEEGNLFYTMYQSVENPTDFIFYEEYKDDAAFKKHSESEHFAAFVQAIKEILNGDVKIEQF